MGKALLLGVVLAAVAGCRSSRTFDYQREPDPRTREYVVGPADQLRINVWRDPDLSLETRVRPDGTFTMPLLGDIRAAGRTPSQIRREVGKQLAKYVKTETAVVTVAVVAVGSYRFAVSGNVERPGVFTSPYYVTVLEAIAMAGGPNRFAAPARSTILRADGTGHTRSIPVNYEGMTAGQTPEQNIVVLAGDNIHVP